MSKKNLVKCTFTSLWDDNSEITTPATYDLTTGEVSAESSNADPKASLVKEYITLPCGEEIEICRTCHEFVLKTVMNPGQAKHDLIEEEVCSNPDCSDEE